MQSQVQCIKEYVKEVCKDRDISHGWKHSEEVSQMASLIANELMITNEYILFMIIVVAMLHDVADHKYNYPVEMLKQYLDENNYETEKILKIIEAVSYSKEVKNPNFLQTLTEEELLIRNIVSDADKLFAIGKIGYMRCYEYTKAKNPQYSEEELKRQIKIHSDEKLLRLKDQFIRTEPGKRFAVPLHHELIQLLETDQ